MKHKTAWPDPEYRYGQPTDAPSRAKCDGCRVADQPCPRHNAPAYATWRARHKAGV